MQEVKEQAVTISVAAATEDMSNDQAKTSSVAGNQDAINATVLTGNFTLKNLTKFFDLEISLITIDDAN